MRRLQLEQAIAALDGQRAALGDAVVEAAIKPLRESLAALESQETLAQEAQQQRKQVTVLFADIPNFTAMSERMDAEDVTEAVNAVWKRVDAVITGNGGRIDKHMGDGVMALWGTGQAQENDPERAIHAALAIQKELADFRTQMADFGLKKSQSLSALSNQQSQIENQQSLIAMRIGVHTGPVLLGEVGITREYTAIGETVNIANRLQTAAPVGGVLISRDTYRHVRGLFDLRLLEPISIKGKSEAVQVYLVRQARPRAFRMGTRGVEGVETRMVGRDGEMQCLQSVLQSTMQDGQCRVVTVSGDAGIGKSRLLYEFNNWLALLPETARLYRGRAELDMQSMPYSLIRDMFASHFAIQESDPRPVALEKMEQGLAEFRKPSVDLPVNEASRTEDQHATTNNPESEIQMRAHFIGELLGFKFGDSPHLRSVRNDPQQLRDHALAYIRDHLVEASQVQPVVLLFEDLHWADDSSLDVIEYLTRAAAPHRLLLVCATRPTLFERRPTWCTPPKPCPENAERIGEYTRLDLNPLSRDDSRLLVDEILKKVDPVPSILRELVISNAEGNPYYVEELLKMLIDDGVIVKQEENWYIDPNRLVQVRVPSTLNGLLQARFDGLPAAERTVLQRASVIGRTFWDNAVQQLGEAGRERLDVTAALESLQRREMIFRRWTSTFAETQEYIFKHALLHEATYESVLKRDRRTYHARAADWLIAHSGERSEAVAGQIAEHLQQAGRSREAILYLQRAGQNACQVSAFREALAFFDRALALQPEAATRMALLIRAGEAHLRISDYAQATQRLEGGLALARQSKDQHSMAEALSHLGSIAREQGDFPKATVQLEESLALAQNLNDHNRVANALDHLGWVYYRLGSYEKARVYFAKSLALYEVLDDQFHLIYTLNGLGSVSSSLGNFNQAESHYAQVLALCRKLDNRLGIAGTLVNLATLHGRQKRYAESKRDFEEALRTFQDIGALSGMVIALDNLGYLNYIQGDYTTAMDCCHQGLKIGMSIHAYPVVIDILSWAAAILAKSGQPQQALELLGLIMDHPAFPNDARSSAVPILTELSHQFPADQVEALLERGKARSLESAVTDLLAELTR